MDFFSRQDQARRKTWILIVYFIIAMLVVTAFINLIAYIVFKIWIFYLEFPNFGRYVSSGSWLDSHIWLYVSLVTISIILIATLHRLWKLGDGGVAVVLLIGARPLLHGSHQHAGQNLINVVEEMAIAAGMPVPQLFILDNEKSINAFVASFHPTESVMVVTRGALDQLNRDELQGVIGHEFSAH